MSSGFDDGDVVPCIFTPSVIGNSKSRHRAICRSPPPRTRGLPQSILSTMRAAFFHPTTRLVHGPNVPTICLQPGSQHLRRAAPTSALRKLTADRFFSSTSRIPIRLGKIELKRVPVQSHDPSPASDILKANQDQIKSAFLHSLLNVRKPTVFRPFLFCLGLSVLGFGVAAHLTNQDTSQKIHHIRTHQGGFPNWLARSFSGHASHLDPSDAQLQQLRRLEKLNFIKQYGLSNVLPHQLLTWYINLGEGKQICCALALINLTIFALWKMDRFSRFMILNFSHYPLSGKSYTLLTATFSHSSTVHFGFNMLALYSIGSTAHDSLTHRLRASRDIDPVQLPESTPSYHFLAFYVFAGLAASLGSHAYSLLVRAPRLIKWRQGTLKTSTPPRPIGFSMGASGAIYGCLTMTALTFPDAHVSLIFLPWVQFKIGNATLCAMLIDFIGVMRNWKTIDHVAHLCGGLAGIFWYFCMDKSFDLVRLKFWHKYCVEENSES